MLKSPLNQSRSCQASPRFSHYAESAHLSRRPSNPVPKPYQYVDASTQWSPPMIPKMEVPPQRPNLADLESEKKARQTEPPVTIAISAVAEIPPIVEPVSQADSPSMKRRQSQETSSIIGSSQTLPPKRVRSAQTPVKILPIRYELCEVEDMVVLIADMISELIQTNDGLPLQSGVLTRFHSR
jgi:hypothetical protein